MPNGFEHPFRGETYTQAVKQLLERVAAEAAEARELHEQLDFLRSQMLAQSYARMARIFAGAGAFHLDRDVDHVNYEFWDALQANYVGWRMAHDDEFWRAMHQGADEPFHP
jgi:hypothetical protein